jgi:hypothetical protein
MLGTHVLSHVLTNPRQDPDNQAHISQTVITIDQAHISQTVITNDQAHISQTVINNHTHADIESIIDRAHDVQTDYYSTHDGQTEQCAHPTTFIETPVITNDQPHISQPVINSNTHADIESIIDRAHDVQTDYYSTHDGQTEQCAHPTTFIETHRHNNVPTHNFKAVNVQAHESKANHSETHDLFFIHFCSIRCYRRRHCNSEE